MFTQLLLCQIYPLYLCAAIIEAVSVCVGLPITVCLIAPLEYLLTGYTNRVVNICYFLEFTLHQSLEELIDLYIIYVIPSLLSSSKTVHSDSSHYAFENLPV